MAEVRLCRSFFCPDARSLLKEFLDVLPNAQTRKARMYKQDHVKTNCAANETTNWMKGSSGREKIFSKCIRDKELI